MAAGRRGRTEIMLTDEENRFGTDGTTIEYRKSEGKYQFSHWTKVDL